jgi:signal transduction histidine kinase
LLGMVERAKVLDGHVHFQRGAGGGTVVTASLPIAGVVVPAGRAQEQT